MIKNIILSVICFYIVGMALGSSYDVTHIVVSSSDKILGSTYYNADGKQTQTQMGCVGSSILDTVYFENNTNETRDSRFNCVSEIGYESRLVARFKTIGPKHSWTKSSDWFSRGSNIDVTSAMTANQYNLSTTTEFSGNTHLFTQSQTFADSTLPTATSFGMYEGNISGTTTRVIDLAQIKKMTVEDYLPCTSCLKESEKPVSYSASGVAYAGYGTAYAARNVNSTGLQGNGTQLTNYLGIPYIKLGKA